MHVSWNGSRTGRMRVDRVAASAPCGGARRGLVLSQKCWLRRHVFALPPAHCGLQILSSALNFALRDAAFDSTLFVCRLQRMFGEYA